MAVLENKKINILIFRVQKHLAVSRRQGPGHVTSREKPQSLKRSPAPSRLLMTNPPLWEQCPGDIENL